MTITLALVIFTLGAFVLVLSVDGLAKEQWTCKSLPPAKWEFVCEDNENKCISKAHEYAKKYKVVLQIQCEQTDWQALLRKIIMHLYVKVDSGISI